ncbi:anoctamin-7-like isoform X2 [Babylonia areolata]|uniref:anoctamin-7-like isoform X2 n=1 Tax=Babylonia areolata TaxID=304850 RepID=UPI003FD58B1E
MADMVGIMEEEESSDVERGKRVVSIREVTSAARVRSRFKKQHHKQKMLRKRMSGFERRYSTLAVSEGLVVEKKRIDYVLVHEYHANDAQESKSTKECQRDLDRAKFTTLLKQQGFTVQTTHIGKYIYTKLFCPFKRLCREAERVKFEMPIKDSAKLVAMSETWFSRFLDRYFETDDQDDYISTQFVMNKIEKFEGHENPNTFFRPAVRSFLTHHILINLNIDELGDDLKERQRTKEEAESPQKKKGLAYMLMKENYTDAFVLHDQSARSSVRGDNFLLASQQEEVGEGAAVGSLPGRDARRELDDTWTRPLKFQPLWKIRNYFGERIAFYFAWSGMLCTTLWIPALFGLCVFFYGIYVSATVDAGSNTTTNTTSLVESFKDLFGDFKQSFDNDITPYFGLVICVWGTIFLEIWKRKNAELAYEWDVEQFEANEPDRPSFSGTKSKKDPVTDDWVWYYPFRLQCFKFCLSFSVLIFMISLVLISVVAIIMYRVIMNIDYCPGLDAASCIIVTTILSSVLNAFSILLLTRVYNVLARKLTEWENHRTQTKFDDALIFKLFAFQFVNSYASCFYIAFFRGRFDSVGFLGDKYRDSCEGSCITQLSFQVLVLMLVKPFPKFFKDIILVWIRKMWRKYPNCCKCLRKLSCCATTNQVGDSDIEASAGLDGHSKDRHTRHLHFLKHEHLKPMLGDFTLDEYTEKIIQYGFLMLFATSFPLAPLLALLTNMIDLRVDAKRLLWWYRRPIADVAQDIGMWYQILLFVNFCGVVSNAFLIAFTSSWGDKYSTAGKLIIVIGFEHIVFALKYVVAYLIPDTPAHVQLSIRREQYQIQRIMEETRKETDYSHLFPVLDMEDVGDDTDAGGDAAAGRHPSAERPHGKGATHVAHRHAGNASRKHYESDTAPPHALESSFEGYVVPTATADPGEELQAGAMNSGGDLWYCVHDSNGGRSGPKGSKHSGKFEARQPSETDLFSSRNSRVSTSDVKPRERNLSWENNESDRVQSPGMLPNTPATNAQELSMFSSPKRRHQSGHSTSEC